MQTQALFFVSDLLQAYWYVALLLPLALFAAIKLLLQRNPALIGGRLPDAAQFETLLAHFQQHGWTA